MRIHEEGGWREEEHYKAATHIRSSKTNLHNPTPCAPLVRICQVVSCNLAKLTALLRNARRPSKIESWKQANFVHQRFSSAKSWWPVLHMYRDLGHKMRCKIWLHQRVGNAVRQSFVCNLSHRTNQTNIRVLGDQRFAKRLLWRSFIIQTTKATSTDIRIVGRRNWEQGGKYK